MFRELIRKDKKLTMEECIHVLKTEKRGEKIMLGILVDFLRMVFGY